MESKEPGRRRAGKNEKQANSGGIHKFSTYVPQLFDLSDEHKSLYYLGISPGRGT
jgi:hypothetical protein